MEDTMYFMSRNHIVYIIPHDQLLFFDHSFFYSILFFILSYLSYPWWSSSFEVDLPLSEALSSVMVSLTLGASDSCLLNCHHLFKSHPSFLVGGYTWPFLQFKCTSCMVRTISNKFLCIMQLFSQYNIHPYLTETFYMPSISTMTSLILCTNPICQQIGFILDK